MKFEGNIPSYLKTGAGSFAVSDKKLANVPKTENLFEKVKFGIKDMAPQQPISIPTPVEEPADPNLFRTIQLNMEQKPQMMAGKKPLPGQMELPMDFPTTSEQNDQDYLDKLDEQEDTQGKTDIFIG